jgi:diaminopimelate epimerase
MTSSLWSDARPNSTSFPELAKKICDRYFGIGADGLILWAPQDQLFDLRIFNRDGSEAECSGNGLRCAAAYLMESGIWQKSEIQLRTVSGVYTLRKIGVEYEADMGRPHLLPAEIPVHPNQANGPSRKRAAQRGWDASAHHRVLDRKSSLLPVCRRT